MAEIYHKMPSEILFIKGEYAAFCFNEACYYIRNKIKVEGQEPVFGEDTEKENEEEQTAKAIKVSSFKELYGRYK